MPLVRSVNDIPSQVERDDLNVTVPIDQGAGEDTVQDNPVNRPRTRHQTRRIALERISAEESRIHHIVDESLSGFRQEVMNMLAEGFRELSLTNQDSNVRHRQDNRGHFEVNQDDNGSVTSRDIFVREDRSSRNDRMDFGRNSERVLNIVRNWRIRFNGDISDVSADEFIYRVRTLTVANLRGDFKLLCEPIHTLFEGKALKWFWRFHKTNGDLNWEDLCVALRRQFKDYYSDFDMMDDILRSKQRSNETFDEFYDAIMLLCDRLRTPFTNYELCETIRRT